MDFPPLSTLSTRVTFPKEMTCNIPNDCFLLPFCLAISWKNILIFFFSLSLFIFNGFGVFLTMCRCYHSILQFFHLSPWSWPSGVCLHSFWFIIEIFDQFCSSLCTFCALHALPSCFVMLKQIASVLYILTLFSTTDYLSLLPICSWLFFTII